MKFGDLVFLLEWHENDLITVRDWIKQLYPQMSVNQQDEFYESLPTLIKELYRMEVNRHQTIDYCIYKFAYAWADDNGYLNSKGDWIMDDSDAYKSVLKTLFDTYAKNKHLKGGEHGLDLTF